MYGGSGHILILKVFLFFQLIYLYLIFFSGSAKWDSRAISFYATDSFYATEPGKTNKIKKSNKSIHRV